MKVYGISDLHLSFTTDKPMSIFGSIWEDHWTEIKKDWENKVEDHDIVLIPGDISWASNIEEVQEDLSQIAEMKGTKIIVRGNHDYWCSSSTGLAKIRKAMPQSILFLRNDAVKIGNYVICGTRGWTVPEKGVIQNGQDEKILARESLRMKSSLEQAKKLKEQNDIIIAMIHYPPFNSTYDDSIFTKLFEDFGVSKVVYGHIHGKISKSRLYIKKKSIEYFLLSCDLVDNNLIMISK